jgi:Flp pilus assembly protein TadG
MLRSLNALVKSEKGAVAPMLAMLFPLMVGVAGLGVDVSHWMLEKRKLQIATDAAAMSAGFEVANSRSHSQALDAATLQATNNGYSSSKGSITLAYATDANSNVTITATLTQQANMWFSNMFMSNQVYVTTTAASFVQMSSGPYCILSLDPTADDAVSVSGTVTVNAAGCGVAVNSSKSDALYLNGNVFVDVGDVHLAGGDQLVGNSYTFDYTGLQTNASTTADPYASISVPSVSAPVYSAQGTSSVTSSGNSTTCTDDQLKTNNQNKWTSSVTLTLPPGRYCGGATFQGQAAITLTPGVYIMDGGSFSAGAGTTISCPTCTGVGTSGVTIIMTNTNTSSGSWGSFNVAGGGNINIQAPSSDPTGYPGFSGIAIYQDRNCGTTCAGNVLTGNANLQVEGQIYTPSANFKFGGTTTVSGATDCTKIISKTVTFAGTPEMGNSCTNSGTKAIGTPSVTLVL